jgi:hypothetical protein
MFESFSPCQAQGRMVEATSTIGCGGFYRVRDGCIQGGCTDLFSHALFIYGLSVQLGALTGGFVVQVRLFLIGVF